MRKREGISLILLMITVVIIIILAGSVISNLANNNLIGKANEAIFKSTTKEYITSFNMKAITSFANGTNQPDLEVASSDIKNYIAEIRSVDENKYNIQNGELTYVGTNLEEGKWSNDMDILNGNPFKLQKINVPNVTVDSESIVTAKATNDEKFVTVTGMTVSSQRHSYINLLDKEYNLIKRVEVYLDNNTYFNEIVVLDNGNIAVTGYTRDASNNLKAIMFLYSSSLDEIKREVYPAPKSGYSSAGRGIVNTSTGGYMVLNTAQRINASQQIVDAYVSIYSYDSSANNILNNVEVRGLDKSLFMMYDAILSPNGNTYLCGNNYKSYKATPNVIGINAAGQVIYEYILSTTKPYGEYRYMSVLSDGRLVLNRIECTSSAGNPYETAIDTIDYLNVITNQIKNINLSIPTGLPKLLEISTGYKDSVFAITVDSSGGSGTYKYKIFKLSNNGDIRWNIIGKEGQTNVILRLFYLSKNKYIAFGQYKETTTSQYATYIAEMIP